MLWNSANILTAEADLISTIALGVDITERKASEQALEKGQIQLAEALDLAHIANWEFDVASGIFTFNDRFYTLYGTTAEREGGYQMPADVYAREFIHPEEVSLVASEVQNAITATDPNYTRNIEHRIIRRDGEIRHIIVRFGITKDAEGRTVKTHGANQDITERKKAEEELRQSECRYRTLSETSRDLIFLIDRDDRVEYVNSCAAAIRGLPADQIIGKKRSSLFPGELGQRQAQGLRRVFETGKAEHSEGIIESSGTPHWFDHYLMPITDAQGMVTSVLGVSRDITDEKKAEESLRESEERFRNISELIPDFAYSCRKAPGGEFGIDWITGETEKITGCTTDEIKKMTCWKSFVIDEDIPVFEKNVTGLSPGESVRCELRIRRKDGGILWLSCYAKCVPDLKEPGYFRLYGGCRDITDRKRAEDVLKRSEAESRSLLENLPELVLVHRNGIILFANPAAVKSLGYQPHEVINRMITDFIAPEFHERVAAAVLQWMNGKPVAPYEIDVIGKEGSRRNMVVNGSTIEFEGAPASLIVLADITGRKRVEEELKRSESRLRAVVEDQTEFICRFTPDGRLTFVNEAYLHYFGLDRTRCLAQSHHVLLPPEDARLMKNHLASLTRENPVATIDHRIIMPSGEIRWQRWNDRAIFGVDGRVIEYQSVGRDITDRKTIEIALHESEERFQQIAESAGEWIWEVDADGVYTFSNAMVYQILGYTPEEMIKRKHFYDLFVPEDEARLKESAFRAFANHEPFKGFVNTNLHKNGDRVILATSGLPVFDTNGTFTGYRGTDIDITTQIRAEEELRQRERELSDIISFLPDATLVIDKNGTALAWNRAMEEMTGVPAEQMIGKADYEYALPFYHERRPITVDLVLHYDPAIAAKYPFMKKEGNSLLSEIYIPHLNKGNGAYLWFKASPLYDTAGNISGVIETIRDITDIKRTEEALRDAHEKYTKAFLSAPVAITISELDTGRFIEVNDAATRIFGYTRDELIGKTALELGILLKKEDRELLIDLVRKQGRVSQFELTERRKSGEEYSAMINADTISIRNVPYLITLVQDITDRKRAEDALRESEERYREFFTISRDSVFITTREGKWIDFNDALLEMFGYKSREEMFEIPVPSIYAHPEERSAFNQLILRQGYVKEYPLQLKQKDGTVIDTTITTVSVRNPDGSPKVFIGTIRNVTEKKHAEEEIRTLQQFQQNIIDNANVWISVLDPGGSILVWNTTAEQISGYRAEEVIGKNTIWKRLYPDPVYRKQVLENILAIIKKNTYVENFETRIRTKEGDEKIIWWNTQPMRDTSGKPVQFITIGRDNTERKLSEEKLRALRQFEESVIKNANIWISVLDHKGNVSVWNRAAEEISGYHADEVIGKNTIWSRMYPDKEYRHTVTAKIKAIIGSKTYLENFETRIRTKDGQERIIWWNTRILQDIPGIDETFIAIGRDVTEQKTLSDALLQANKQLNLLSSITRHDILNQLLALKGYLELSRNILSDPVKLENYIIKEQNIADRIEEQIQFAKDYEDMGIKAPEWQNVHKIVEKARQNLPLGGIAVETDSLVYEVYADMLLIRVFYNLIENALRYGGEQMTAIRFSSQESGRGLEIVCEDNGVGIRADMKEAIFTRGYYQHTGLGLLLSREILAITGITITENGTPKKGARFEIIIPKEAFRRTGTGEK